MAETEAKQIAYDGPERVYPPVIAAAHVWFRTMGVKVTIDGAHHVPRTGPVVLASNHVSYLDFIFAGWGARPSKRLTRFMAKEQVFNHRISGPLMRGMKHIPVDREAGSASFREAMRALKAGQVVGVFPEATISRSFTVKDYMDNSRDLPAGTYSAYLQAFSGGATVAQGDFEVTNNITGSTVNGTFFSIGYDQVESFTITP